MVYTAEEHGKIVDRVLLDGMEFRNCVAADPDEGWVEIVLIQYVKGELLYDKKHNRLPTRIVRGKVHIAFTKFE
jgi:hypothetical protein